MMRKRLYGCLMALAVLVCAGCGGVQQLLKQGQPEPMYRAAKEYYAAQKWTKAAPLFEGAAPYYIGRPQEDSIAYMHAYSKFRTNDFAIVTSELEAFRRRFPRSLFLQDAEELLARSYYNLSPGATRDQSMTMQALVAINEYLTHYPDSEKAEAFRAMDRELTARLHEKEFLNAYTYYKIERYRSAIVALRNALKVYPQSEYRERTMYLIVKSSYELAANSVAEKQTDRYLSMLDSYYSFVAEFPQSEHARELDRLAEHAKVYLEKHNQEE